MEEDLQILTLPYNNDLSSLYSQTNNIFVLILIGLQFLLLISLLLITFLVPLNHNNWTQSISSEKNPLLDSYAITIYSHIILWIIILIIRYYMQKIYYKRLRVLGYHKHHQKVQCLASIPSIVLHKSNALLLLLTTILCKYNDKVIKISNAIELKPINMAQIIITIAVIIIMPFLIKLFYHELKFRSERNPPDIFCVEDPQHEMTSAGLNQIGVRSSSYLEDLLEKQADLIYNLKLQNTHLRVMLYKVTQRTNRESLQSS